MTSRFIVPLAPSTHKDWHSFVTPDARVLSIQKLVRITIPSFDLTETRTPIANALLTSSRNIEKASFEKANSKEEYYQSLARKIDIIQKGKKKSEEELEQKKLDKEKAKKELDKEEKELDKKKEPEIFEFGAKNPGTLKVEYDQASGFNFVVDSPNGTMSVVDQNGKKENVTTFGSQKEEKKTDLPISLKGFLSGTQNKIIAKNQTDVISKERNTVEIQAEPLKNSGLGNFNFACMGVPVAPSLSNETAQKQGPAKTVPKPTQFKKEETCECLSCKRGGICFGSIISILFGFLVFFVICYGMVSFSVMDKHKETVISFENKIEGLESKNAVLEYNIKMSKAINNILMGEVVRLKQGIHFGLEDVTNLETTLMKLQKSVEIGQGEQKGEIKQIWSQFDEETKQTIALTSIVTFWAVNFITVLYITKQAKILAKRLKIEREEKNKLAKKLLGIRENNE